MQSIYDILHVLLQLVQSQSQQPCLTNFSVQNAERTVASQSAPLRYPKQIFPPDFFYH
jgi:hypothetical protein